MDRLGIYFNNLFKQLVHKPSSSTTQVKRFCGHPFIRWNAPKKIFFIYAELKRLPKRFGQPDADKLSNLLTNAELGSVNANTRAMIEGTMGKCSPCQTYAQAPRGFKLALRKEKDTNNTVFFDNFYIDSKPILHVADEATRYQAARCLPKITAETVGHVF